MKDNTLYLHDMREAILKIEGYLRNISEAEFSQNYLLNDGVLHELMILGEAANQVEENFQERHAAMPWRKIIGLRNKIVHAYSGIDLKNIWSICREALPKLKEQPEAILRI
jgi:uncharacterized protein with HEPN domain